MQAINFFTTYQCNSKCVNCNIWKRKNFFPHKKMLSADRIIDFFNDPSISNIPIIGLAGGEPTISPFFWKMLEIIPTEKHVTITTNALKSDLLTFLDQTEFKNRYTIQVSLDGLDDKNDEMRGIKGAFDKTIFLLQGLEKLNISRLVSFTISKRNYRDLLGCYEIAEKYDAQFSMRMAYSGGAYLNKSQNSTDQFNQHELNALESTINQIIDRELAKPHYAPKIVFMKKIVDYYRGRRENPTCHALESGLVIDLYGEVFPNCPALMQSMGNVNDAPIKDILEGKKAHKLRKKIETFQCGGCWNDCQVVSNISLDKDFLEKEYTQLKMEFVKNRPIMNAIDFNKEESPLILTGWYELNGEPSLRYRWTEPEFSVILPAMTQKISMNALFPQKEMPMEQTKLDLYIDHEKMAELTFDSDNWKEYTISLKKPRNDLSICNFRLNGFFNPTIPPGRKSPLKYGLAIHRILFS